MQELRQPKINWELILLIVVMTMISSQIFSQGNERKPKPEVGNILAVETMPGLKDMAYQPGLADQFGAYTSQKEACRNWQVLSEPLRRGLAFVDGRVLPDCAPMRYRTAAIRAHLQRPWNQYSNQYPAYYDMGMPEVSTIYWDKWVFTCEYLDQLTAQNYGPVPFPRQGYGKPGFDEAYKKWNEHNRVIGEVRNMYENGGDFPEGCYPPSAVFGPNGSLKFYPNQPVMSIRETAAPVFHSPGGCTVCGQGAEYTVKPGDTLRSITECYYGYDHWQLIVATNEIPDVKRLHAGDVIYLPGVEASPDCREHY